MVVILYRLELIVGFFAVELGYLVSMGSLNYKMMGTKMKHLNVRGKGDIYFNEK